MIINLIILQFFFQQKMGNRTNLVQESPQQIFKPNLSKSIRRFSIGAKPVKAVFSKLSPKPLNIDDELSLEDMGDETGKRIENNE